MFGLGLLGGSIALRLKRINPDCYVQAYVRDPAKSAGAVEGGIADEVVHHNNIDLSSAGVVIIAAPVGISLDIIKKVLNHKTLRPDTLVMDVGSVKQPAVKTALETGNPGNFVGCHPMAGSEKSGYQHASENLYFDTSVIITPSKANSSSFLDMAEKFWSFMGARAISVEPGEHDRILAYTSHLPHFAATAIASVLKKASEKKMVPGNESISAFIGNGFRDTTRVAGGSSAMWTDIAVQNKAGISEAIDMMIDELLLFKKQIEDSGEGSEELKTKLEEIKKFRSEIK